MWAAGIAGPVIPSTAGWTLPGFGWTVGGGAGATAGDGVVIKYGFRFAKEYHDKLYETGRGAPGLIAREVLEACGKQGVPDPRGLPGFFKYIGGGWEMVFNPTTGEVIHLVPL
jgi:filamentous hemagglutinin